MKPTLSIRITGLAAAATAALLISGSGFAQTSGTGATGSSSGMNGATSGAGSALNSATDSVRGAGSRAASAVTGGMARTDAGFMKQASENGHLEIEASTVAMKQATSPQVKEFAQHMVDDHTKVNTELMALAKTKNVEVPMDPSMLQKTKMELMEHSKGANFDRRYIDSIGVKAHEQTIALFQKAATGAKDPEVKAWAVKTLPSLQAHLVMARKLQASLVASK